MPNPDSSPDVPNLQQRIAIMCALVTASYVKSIAGLVRCRYCHRDWYMLNETCTTCGAPKDKAREVTPISELGNAP
jgi:ribosomal protein L37E